MRDFNKILSLPPSPEHTVSVAWLGLVASLLLVAVLTLRLAGFLEGAIKYYAWIPMALFEVTLAGWLLFKGAAAPLERRS